MKQTAKPVSAGTINIGEYQSAEQYKPKWFSKEDGWNGETYDDADKFCAQKANMDICPYSVVCPSGPLNIPYGGTRTGDSEVWAPLDDFNSWVSVGPDRTCVQWKNIHLDAYPDWGLIGGGQEVTHVLCCADTEKSGVGNVDETLNLVYDGVQAKYQPKFFDRSGGWNGVSYTDAISFCAEQDSYSPCPLEAYCPAGPGTIPFKGYDSNAEAWAPIIDIPNGWVSVGSPEKETIENSCMQWNLLHKTPPLWGIMGNAETDLTPFLMCCKVPDAQVSFTAPSSVVKALSKSEQDTIDQHAPVWYSRKHGWHGETFQDAGEFCKAIGDKVLCPYSAYCPDGSDSKLFLNREPFLGMQWAPMTFESGESNTWVSVGTDPSPCATYDQLFLGDAPGWGGLDGSEPELKENILCCQNPKHLAKIKKIKEELDPIWMDLSHGWRGGSSQDAADFCAGFGNRKVCPYIAYCPHGPSLPVMGGHSFDLSLEGAQWAPIYGNNNWVMVSQMYGNSATTCMDTVELLGKEPAWGLTGDRAEQKKNLLCCHF